MEPHNTSLDNVLNKRNVLIVLIIVGLLVVLSIGNIVRKSIGFQVTGTNPKMSSVAAISPYITFGFNKDVSSKGISVTSSPTNFVTSTEVSGKNMQVNLKFNALKPDQKYSITLKSVSSTGGKKITNKTFTFTARDISYDELDSAAQQKIVANQDHFTYTVDTYAFDGIGAITDQEGLSSDQEQALRQAVFNYSKQLNKEFKLVTLYTQSLQEGPNNPSTGGGTIYFSLGIDGTTYAAQMDHWNLTVMRLYLRDQQTNQLVYDSGDIDGFNLTQ